MRIKAKDIKVYRDKMFKQQAGICLLCNKPMLPKEAVLDHCHSTGFVRGVLHASCNGAEGRIAGAIYRSRAGNLIEDLVDFTQRLSVYWSQDYSKNVIHPKHLIPEEKELKRLKKYQKGLKTQAAKDRKQLEIDIVAENVKLILKGL